MDTLRQLMMSVDTPKPSYSDKLVKQLPSFSDSPLSEVKRDLLILREIQEVSPLNSTLKKEIGIWSETTHLCFSSEML